MIAVENLTVRLGDATVLEDVSLSVDAGEFVGLVGPNGAGKTTLLQAINGRLTPAAGTVRLDGESITDLSAREIGRRVGTVHQDTSVQFAFDVETVVAMGRTPHRSRLGGDPDGHDAVEHAIERTGIAHLRDRRISEVSGGERQRVFVARSLAQDAPTLLLDEPTASLDVNHAARTLGLVRQLVDEGKTALAAIHDLEAAARYCDRLVLMHDGEIVARGSPATVLTEESVARAFDVESVVTPNPVTGAPTVTALPATRDDVTRRVHVLGGGTTGARVVGDLWAGGHDVSVGPLPPEDTTATVARSLGVEATTAPPFAAIDDDTSAAVERSVRGADITVVADPTIAPGTPILSLADAARSLVVVEERPLPVRNHAGREGERAYRRVRERGTVVGVGEVAATIADLPSDPVPSSTD